MKMVGMGRRHPDRKTQIARTKAVQSNRIVEPYLGCIGERVQVGEGGNLLDDDLAQVSRLSASEFVEASLEYFCRWCVRRCQAYHRSNDGLAQCIGFIPTV